MPLKVPKTTPGFGPDINKEAVLKATPILNRFNFGELSPLIAGRVDFSKYQAGCKRLENFIPLVQGPISRRGGTRFIAKSANGNNPVALLRFEFSESTAYIIEAGHLYLRFYYAQSPVEKNGAVYQISTPWQQKDIFKGDLCLLKYVQSGDVLYVVSPGQAPQKICRYGHTDWRIKPLGGWASIFTKTITETVTNEAKISNNKALEIFRNTTKIYPPEAPIITPDEGISFRSFGFIHDSPALKDILKFVPNDGYYHLTTTQKTKQVHDAERAATSNPTAITLFRERLCLAAGQTIWMSASGAFEDFTSPGDDPKADDPIEISIYSEQINKIEWLCPGGSLLVGTSGGEFMVSESTSVDPLGPANVKVRPETNYGSAPISALRIGGAVLFVQRTGRKLRELAYDYSGDNYTAQDISIAAEHISQSGFVAMAWQGEPYEILWLVKRNGELIGFTYNREQEMTAWHRHIFQNGQVESLAVIASLSGEKDELWLAVQRKIKGQTVRYIEVMEEGLADRDKQADSFFVDCGFKYTGAATKTIDGLWPLEGEEVAILADGGITPPQTVKNGKISLPEYAQTVIAGLAFRSLMETMPLELSLNGGSIQGKTKRLTGAVLRLNRSLGGHIGPDETCLESLERRTPFDPMSVAPPLFTGDVKAKWPGGSDDKASIVVMQNDPLPLTLCAIIPSVILD